MDKNLLIYHMKTYGDTSEELANAIGINPITLRRKMNGHYEFTSGEIKTIAGRYQLSADEIVKIFLSDRGKTAAAAEHS